MAVKAEQLLRVQLDQLPKDHPERPFMQAELDAFAAFNAARRDGIAPEAPKAEAMSREAVQAEIERQAGKYLELGFHKKLRTSPGRFKDGILDLVVPQPETFVGRFDIPVVTFGQIPVKDQAKMAGIEYYLDGLSVRDWEQDPRGYRTPEGAYLTWMQDGTINLNKKPTAVRDALATDERGATIQDGIGLYIVRPEVLKNHFIDLPGTVVGSDGVAGLDLWDGRPELGGFLADDAYPVWGSASSGRV